MNREIGERGAGVWPPAILPSHLLLGLSFHSHDLSCAIVVQCGCRLCGHCWDWHFILMLCAMTFSKAFYLAPVALRLTKKKKHYKNPIFLDLYSVWVHRHTLCPPFAKTPKCRPWAKLQASFPLEIYADCNRFAHKCPCWILPYYGPCP